MSGMAEGEVRRPDDPDHGAPSEAGESPDLGSAQQGRTRPIWLAALAAIVFFLALYGTYARQSSDGVDDSPASPAGLFRQAQAVGTSLTAVGRTAGLAQP